MFYNSFDSIGLRAILSCLTAFVVGLVLTKSFIKQEAARYMQPIREDGPQTHQKKRGTPTMGGVFILAASIISSSIFASWSNVYFAVTMTVFLFFGLVGLADDYLKVTLKATKTLKGSTRLIIELVFSGLICLLLYYLNTDSSIDVPFVSRDINLSIWYASFAMLVLVGTANSVNFTDGLDGLAIIPVITCLSIFLLILGISGAYLDINIFRITIIKGLGEVIVLVSSVIGASIAFFIFNKYPAKIFNGDVGALALGGLLGVLAIMLKVEFAFFLMSMLFLLETVSVIIQMASYKIRHKPFFLMAPIHHHFEKMGWSETKVVLYFWAFACIFQILGLLSLMY